MKLSHQYRRLVSGILVGWSFIGLGSGTARSGHAGAHQIESSAVRLPEGVGGALRAVAERVAEAASGSNADG